LTARSLAASAIHVRFALDPSGRRDLQIRDDKSRRKKKSSVYEKTLTLPVPMRNSKLLLNLLRLQLQGDPPEAPILKLFMAAEAAKPRGVQTGLFLPPSPDVAKLELTIARLGNLVGDSNIGSPQLVDTHRPNAFRMDRFVPPQDETKTTRRKNGKRASKRGRPIPTVDSIATKSAIGFRMFRPPLPVNVHMLEDRPRKVMFRGARGEVVAASGPWRTSGDWWREDIWHQDEWDLEIVFHISPGRLQKSPASCPQQGLYRLYFDSICQGWFVRGIYD
jgi:protein ImuB